MATTKRSNKEIEKDFKRIREAAKTATSIRDIERATNLSYAEVNTTLSKHPTIFKKIKELVAKNKENAELEKQKRKVQENLAKKEKKPKLKAEKAEKLAAQEVSKTNLIANPESSKKETMDEIIEGFVIDVSITGIEDLKGILSKICTTKAKVILTSVTIKELNNMQKFHDIDATDARYIMGLAAENPECFECVLINENFDLPDDCIINYCAENKERLTLLTSDKDMTLRARMYGIQVQYFKQPANKNSSEESKTSTKVKLTSKANHKIETFYSAKRVGNALLLDEFQTDRRAISLFSNGLEYTDGIRKLQVGDEIFVATKKEDYITFAHYKMISLSDENNCELIYSKRIYNYYDNIDVPNATYKSFIKDFKSRQDL